MKIVVTDHNSASLAAMQGTLREWGHEIDVAADLPAIWDVLLQSNTPVIAIIDCLAPGLGGLDVFRNIRATVRHRPIYLVMLTSRTDTAFIDEALEAGADSYLARPIGAADLRICIESGRRLLEMEEALTVCATRDALTGLHNRDSIMEHLRKETVRCQRERSALSIIYTDLDRLREINEHNGHVVGDIVLRAVSQRLGNVLRSYDHLGRCGDDELLMILPRCNTAGALEVAERARMVIAAYPITAVTGEVLATITSVTATVSGKNDVPAGTLLQLAETAMYRAKDEGRNRVGLANLYCSIL